jgi:hypothetical protein
MDPELIGCYARSHIASKKTPQLSIIEQKQTQLPTVVLFFQYLRL